MANSIASLFAPALGREHRSTPDGTPEVIAFADKPEKVCVDTVEGGQLTTDLAPLISRDAPWLTTDEFMTTLDENFARS